MKTKTIALPVWRCQQCGKTEPVRRSKKYCGDKCRSDAFRQRQYAKGLVRTPHGWRKGERPGHQLRRLSDEERTRIADLARARPDASARELVRLASSRGVASDVPYRTVCRIARQAREARSARPEGLSA